MGLKKYARNALFITGVAGLIGAVGYSVQRTEERESLQFSIAPYENRLEQITARQEEIKDDFVDCVLRDASCPAIRDEFISLIQTEDRINENDEYQTLSRKLETVKRSDWRNLPGFLAVGSYLLLVIGNSRRLE